MISRKNVDHSRALVRKAEARLIRQRHAIAAQRGEGEIAGAGDLHTLLLEARLSAMRTQHKMLLKQLETDVRLILREAPKVTRASWQCLH